VADWSVNDTTRRSQMASKKKPTEAQLKKSREEALKRERDVTAHNVAPLSAGDELKPGAKKAK
jgi:Tfp pilus assembly protein FimT